MLQLSSYKYLYLVCCSSILFTLLLFLNYFSNSPSHLYYRLREPDKGLTRCQIPRLDPFQSEAMEILKSVGITEKDLCRKVPLLFKSPVNDGVHSFIVPLIPKEEFKKMGIDSCCYRVVTGAPHNQYTLSDTCTPLSLTRATKMPDDCEFAAVYCSLFTNDNSTGIKYPYFQDKPLNQPIFVDIHYFVPFKKEVEKRLESKSLPPSEERLNILFIGIDAVSRNNLIRAMPHTYKFLMEELEAVDMKGYNKIGHNTFPCLTPLFFSMTEMEVRLSCGKYAWYDSCPFIWKAFAERGYRTSFHDDVPQMDIFVSNDGTRLGFHAPPADYFSQPGMLAALKEAGDGNWYCNGPRFSNTALWDYTKKFVLRMDSKSKSYFHFVWSGALTHDLLENSMSQDVPLSSLLKWLRDGGHLRNTALVLLSDHGIHFVSKSGSGLTSDGLENQLPFMFLVLPQSFKEKYSEAYQNLQANSEYRLTTTFDLHQTLMDILEPERLQSDQLMRRELELRREQELNNSMPRGISQFLEIPESRTCDNAAIPSIHCACLGTWESVSTQNGGVTGAAKFAVSEINAIVVPANCSSLNLSRVLTAKMSVVGGRESGKKLENAKMSYLVQFETIPGKALYEAQVLSHENHFAMASQINRLDRYAAKGHGKCVKGRSIEKYCYCARNVTRNEVRMN